MECLTKTVELSPKASESFQRDNRLEPYHIGEKEVLGQSWMCSILHLLAKKFRWSGICESIYDSPSFIHSFVHFFFTSLTICWLVMLFFSLLSAQPASVRMELKERQFQKCVIWNACTVIYLLAVKMGREPPRSEFTSHCSAAPPTLVELLYLLQIIHLVFSSIHPFHSQEILMNRWPHSKLHNVAPLRNSQEQSHGMMLMIAKLFGSSLFSSLKVENCKWFADP